MKHTMKAILIVMSVATFSQCKKKVTDNPSPGIYNLNIDSNRVNSQRGSVFYTGIDVDNVSISLYTNYTVSQTEASKINMYNYSSELPLEIKVFGKEIKLRPIQKLKYLSRYKIVFSKEIKAENNGVLNQNYQLEFNTTLDTLDKFPRLNTEAFLDKIQSTHLKYFWDFGHPTSYMARERDQSGDVVTTGGTGFGIMSMIVGVNRGFISRTDAVNRLNTLCDFLTNKCTRYHGAFAHWVNGQTGATIPFSPNDDGGDLVETSYLMQGLLCARQYFNANTSDEIALKNKINDIYQAVDWNWYQKNNENVLYWHWSANKGWAMNMQIKGYNEALITYVMAACSPTHPISKTVYQTGWANNGGIKNGKNFYGIKLPLGYDYGGPLFFAHYAFLGINPIGLSDAYGDYWEQNTAHANIHLEYCKANPKRYYGYSADCWGLTASDDINGYMAHEPNNDNSVISPTAACASMPYTPQASLRAMEFYYYKLGDKIWGNYGFMDGFSLQQLWYSNTYLAIDQGPIVVMIENYRSKLLWDLFTSCSEVKIGMKNLGFTAPYIP